MSKIFGSRSERLRKALLERVLVLDGAMGTALQAQSLVASDFGGTEYEGCNEQLVLTRPDVIRGVHVAYLQAGCDIIETNTFGATPLVLSEYGLNAKTYQINFQAARIARELAEEFSAPAQPRFVAGSVGPTTKALSVTGGITFEELQNHFYAQAQGLIEGGIDYFLLETCQDTRNIKAAAVAIGQAMVDLRVKLPIAVSGTIQTNGTMLAGQGVEALLTSLSHLDLLYIGLNCATGPEFMTDHLRSLSGISRVPIACAPNAGLPDENGRYPETPEMFAHKLGVFLREGWLNVVGGCCGTHAGHIRALAELAGKFNPRRAESRRRAALSGVDYLEVTDEIRPIIVGERTNSIGSRKFKTLINEGRFEEASEVARGQIRNGAQVIDVCLANPDRDELNDMRSFLEFAARKIRVPLMIDSIDPKVVEAALTYSQGKAIINSVNLEDGEDRLRLTAPLARKYGAALVVGCIDNDPNQGMAISRARKLEVAERAFKILTEKYEIPVEDLWFDPLVFPCASGDVQYIGSAVETIEGVRLIKKRFPECKTILGISNVSFGLPSAGREILNSVFLYHCVQAGLDAAIVNAEKLERYASIPEAERKLAEDLIFSRGPNPVQIFAEYFRDRRESTAKRVRSPSVTQRLANAIVEGTKESLTEDLNEALETLKPLQIINDTLLKGMDEVGKLFNANQLIVAEVLQSAEVMRAAVSHLERSMEKGATAVRSRFLLATVKGDVHDIGKNLVQIVFANNGFEVIDLGIRVNPEQLIAAVQEQKPDLIGLSGLLVKSAHQMVATLEDLSRAGIKTPVLVGGAALSRNFVDFSLAPAYGGTVEYATNAMSGLETAKTILDPARHEALRSHLGARRAAKAPPAIVTAEALSGGESIHRSANIHDADPVPMPPDFERHVMRNHRLESIWRFINPLMLYGRHLGIAGGTVRLLSRSATDPSLRREIAETDSKALQIWDAVEEVKQIYGQEEVLRPRSVYQFFRIASTGNQLHLFDSNDLSKPSATFNFFRQPRPDGLCLADYAPALSSGKWDTFAAFVVTVGQGLRPVARRLNDQGQYLKSHILQALALESAEAYAEFLHSKIREMWGFVDPPEMTMMDRFQTKYRGRRYSFGYPACPRLDDQKKLFELLRPQEIGIHLTEGMMMDPEASVSALVFHHPQAFYFSIGDKGGGR